MPIDLKEAKILLFGEEPEPVVSEGRSILSGRFERNLADPATQATSTPSAGALPASAEEPVTPPQGLGQANTPVRRYFPGDMGEVDYDFGEKPPIFGDISNAFKQGTMEMVRGLGLGLQIGEERLKFQEQPSPVEMAADPNFSAMNAYQKQQAAPYASIGRRMEQYAGKTLTAHPEWERPKELQGREWTDLLKDPKTRGRYLARAVFENLPNLGGGIVATGATLLGTRNPAAAAMVGYQFSKTLEGGFSLKDIEKLTGDRQAAAEVAETVGVVNGLLEFAPIGRLFAANPVVKRKFAKMLTEEIATKPFLRRAAVQGAAQLATEGATEGLQEVVANVGKRFYDENQDILEGVGESAFIGGLMGGGAGVVGQVGPTRGPASKPGAPQQPAPDQPTPDQIDFTRSLTESLATGKMPNGQDFTLADALSLRNDPETAETGFQPFADQAILAHAAQNPAVIPELLADQTVQGSGLEQALRELEGASQVVETPQPQPVAEQQAVVPQPVAPQQSQQGIDTVKEGPQPVGEQEQPFIENDYGLVESTPPVTPQGQVAPSREIEAPETPYMDAGALGRLRGAMYGKEVRQRQMTPGEAFRVQPARSGGAVVEARPGEPRSEPVQSRVVEAPSIPDMRPDPTEILAKTLGRLVKVDGKWTWETAQEPATSPQVVTGSTITDEGIGEVGGKEKESIVLTSEEERLLKEALEPPPKQDPTEWQNKKRYEWLGNILNSTKAEIERESKRGPKELKITDLTLDMLKDVNTVKAKQQKRTIGGITDITYVLTAKLDDGTEVYAGEVGHYKVDERPPWQRQEDGSVVADEEISNRNRQSRKGARIDRDINLWALNRLIREAKEKGSPAETLPETQQKAPAPAPTPTQPQTSQKPTISQDTKAKERPIQIISGYEDRFQDSPSPEFTETAGRKHLPGEKGRGLNIETQRALISGEKDLSTTYLVKQKNKQGYSAHKWSPVASFTSEDDAKAWIANQRKIDRGDDWQSKLQPKSTPTIPSVTQQEAPGSTIKGEGIAEVGGEETGALSSPQSTYAAQNRWDSAKLGVKVEWAKRSLWVTRKGKLSKVGEKIAESKWDELSPAAQRILEKTISQDYEVARPTIDEARGALQVAERKAAAKKAKQAQRRNITLVEWVKLVGGIRPDDPSFKGELRDATKDSRGRRVPPGFFNSKSPWTMDTLAQEAMNEGFITENSDDALMAALERDINASISGDQLDRVYKSSYLESDEYIELLAQKAYDEWARENYSDEEIEDGTLERDEAEAQAALKGEVVEEVAREERANFDEVASFFDDIAAGQESSFLTPEEPTPYEKVAELERKGVMHRPAKDERKAAVFPKGSITPPTGGKQKGLFGPEKGENLDLFDQAARGKKTLKPSGLPADASYFTHDPNAFDGYAWRTMGEAEYRKLVEGEKEYGGKDARKGNFLAPTPESASQYKDKGKYLVEFAGVEKAEGETVTNRVTRDNIVSVKQWDGEKWVDVYQKQTDVRFSSTQATIPTKPLSPASVRLIAKSLTKGWKNAASIEVVKSVGEITDEGIRKALRTDMRIKGVFAGKGDQRKIFLVSENLGSRKDVADTLLEETLGHDGLRQAFGDKLNPFLDQVYAKHGDQIRPVAKRYRIDLSEQAGQREATDEWIAKQIATDTLPRQIWDRIVAAIRGWIRQIMPGLKVSVAEAKAMAREAIMEGPAMKGKGAAYRFLMAWHGTPHVWQPEPGFPHGRPRLDKIGTGEGGAAYGWGFYTTDSRGLAEEYQKKLAHRKIGIPEATGYILIGDSLIDLSTVDDENQYNSVIRSRLLNIVSLIERGHSTPEDTYRYINEVADKIRFSQYGQSKFLTSVLDAIRSAKITYENANERILFDLKPTSSLYTLEIPDDVIPKLLDWDKPLSEQTEEVRVVLNREVAGRRGIENQIKLMQEEIESRQGDFEFDSYSAIERVKTLKRVLNKTPEAIDSKTGEEIYRILSSIRGGDKAASEYLASIGIPGNTHGGISKGATGAKFVIWDQDVLDRIALLERNAEKLDAIREVEGDVRFNAAPPTDSPAFRKWFGDSKVVDENGKPLVVYHGTDKSFTEFDEGMFGSNTGSSDKGFFFVRNPSDTAYFAEGIYSDVDRPGANVVPAYLSMKNPLIIDFFKDSDVSERLGIFSNEEAITYAKDNGFDGVIFPAGSFSDPGEVYIAFSPTQIKSAIGNVGTYDPANPDIRFSQERKATVKDFLKATQPAPTKAPFRNVNEGKEKQYAKVTGADHGLVAKGSDAISSTIQALREASKEGLLPGGFWDKLITSPEWTRNEVEKTVVQAAIDRDLDRHNLFYHLDHEKETDSNGWEVLKALKNRGVSVFQRVRSRELYNPDKAHISKEYRQVWDAVNHMDEQRVRWDDTAEETIPDAPEMSETKNTFRLTVNNQAGFDKKGMDESTFKNWSGYKTARGEGVRFIVGKIDGEERLQSIQFRKEFFKDEAAIRGWLQENRRRLGGEKGYRSVLEAKGVSQDVIGAIDQFRKAMDKSLNLQRAKIKEVINAYNAAGKTVPTLFVEKDSLGKPHAYTLKDAYEEMGTHEGYYAPRIRENGDWIVTGEKDGQFHRYHTQSRRKAIEMEKALRREGFEKLSHKRDERSLPETIYEDLTIGEVGKALEEALEGVSKDIDPDVQLKLRMEAIQAASDMLKARAFRAHKIARKTGMVVKGFIEDPLTRYILSLNQVAGGIAKGMAAQKMFDAYLGQYRKFERDDDTNTWVYTDDREQIHSRPMTAEEIDGDKQTKTMRVGGLDAGKHKELHGKIKDYIVNQLRNPDRYDRMVGLGKSIVSFKFLGFNPRSMLVNTTAMIQTVPPAIHAYALDGKGDMTKILAAVARAGKDYARVMRGKKLLNSDEQTLMDEIQEKGYDAPQYMHDALGSIHDLYGGAWSNVMNLAMKPFGITEQWNRGSTILAAYRLIKRQNPGISHEDAAAKAMEASNRAHGQYGKATLPAWAQGKGPGGMIGQMLYTYQKFGHNYVQMLADLGFQKKNIKALSFALAAPAIISGGSASLVFAGTLALVRGMLAALGYDDDPEKMVYDTIRKEFGNYPEQVARYGLFGALGIDISGSIAIGMEVPRTLLDLTGPFGGVYESITDSARYLKTGQPWRAVERAAPMAAGNIMTGIREIGQGASTKRGYPIFDEEGKPYEPGPIETGLKVAGFRGSRRAAVGEREWESKRTEGRLADRKSRIYEQYRAWVKGGGSTEELQEIMDDVRAYNERVERMGFAGIVPKITPQSLKRQLKRMTTPTKAERGRRQMQQ